MTRPHDCTCTLDHDIYSDCRPPPPRPTPPPVHGPRPRRPDILHLAHERITMIVDGGIILHRPSGDIHLDRFDDGWTIHLAGELWATGVDTDDLEDVVHRAADHGARRQRARARGGSTD